MPEIWSKVFSLVKNWWYEVHPERVTYIASLPPKVRELERLLEGVHFEVKALPDLPTLETLNLRELAEFRAKQAFWRVKTAVIIDETSMELLLPDLEDEKSQNSMVLVRPMAVLTQIGVEQFAKMYQNVQGNLHVVFAYTDDGEHVSLFEGSLKGQIVYPLRKGDGKENEDWCGWDAMWMPENESKTLAESYRTRQLITHRQLAVLQMRSEVFEAMRYPGVYELHVTIDIRDEPTYISDFQKVCQELRQQWLVLRLLHSESKVQLQLQTKRYYTFKTQEEAIQEVLRLGKEFSRRGFPSVRHRVEAISLRTPDVPQTDEDAKRSSQHYFEMHTRVKHHEYGLKELQQVLGDFMDVKISMSGMNREKMFINKRYYGVGRMTVVAEWDAILSKLSLQGWQLKRVLPEYCVFDDQPHMDDD